MADAFAIGLTARRFPALRLAAAAALTLLAGSVQAADVKVGVTAAVNPQAIGQPPTEPERVLMVGNDNFANEKITTGPAGQVQLLFTDGSSVSVGPDAALTIDQYVYDPGTKRGKLALSAAQGIFRVVGGAISKNDEVTIRTPTMTAGIRGGIGVFSARPNQPHVAGMLFGDRLRVSAAGQTQEATRPGFAITVPGPGQPPLPPVRMTASDVAATNGQFQGRRQSSGASGQGSGGQGGEQEPAQDKALADSNVSSATGSTGSPASLATVGQLANSFNAVFNPNNLTQIQNLTTQVSAQTVTTVATQNVGFDLYGIFACCSGIYSSFDKSNFTGSYSSLLQKLKFRVVGTSGNQFLTFTLNGVDVRIPWVPGTSQNGSFSANGISGTGTLRVAPDQQFFGLFGTITQGGSGDNKFGVFGGVPSTSLPTSGFSTYRADPILATIPFVANEQLPGRGASGVTISDAYVAWSPNTSAASTTSGQRATAMQASLYIQGTGTSQRSGLIGMTGAFFQVQGSTVGFDGGMVGMTRDGALGVSTRYGSGAGSVEIQTGSGLGNAIYGPNGEFIVIGPDQINGQPNADSVRTPGAQGQVPFDTLTQNTSPDFYLSVLTKQSDSILSNLPTTRTSQILQGYTGGLMETRLADGSFQYSLFGQFLPGANTTIITNADNNRMFAQMGFTAFSPANGSYVLNFGGTEGFGGGRSSFISDYIFAARESINTAGNPTSQIGGVTVPFAKLFMVSSSVVPIDFQSFAGPGVTACACDFMKWGWWIGEVQRPNTANIRDRFNIATWVAGVLPGLNEIPTTGTAVYNGHAIGNVAALVNGGMAQYIAAGNFQMSWNFASKSGGVSIANFDRGGALGPAGFNASGSVSSSNGRDFTGGLSGPSSISGGLAGSFYKDARVGDPVRGVGGSFVLSNNAYKTGGTFMGQR